MTLRRLLYALSGIVIVLSAVVMVFSAITTSSARVAASTGSSGFFASGEVVLNQPGRPVDVLFDTDELYPGVEVTGCVIVEYDGTVPVEIRVHGRAEAGTGLDAYLDLVLVADQHGLCPEDGSEEGREDGDAATGRTLVEVYRDRLSGLWERHSSYGSGIVIATDVVQGDRVALHGTASLVDDNQAQGLMTEFVIVIEARP